MNATARATEVCGLAGVFFEVRAFGLVPGLGSHVSWETRLDGRIAGALLSIDVLALALRSDPADVPHGADAAVP